MLGTRRMGPRRRRFGIVVVAIFRFLIFFHFLQMLRDAVHLLGRFLYRSGRMIRSLHRSCRRLQRAVRGGLGAFSGCLCTRSGGIGIIGFLLLSWHQ